MIVSGRPRIVVPRPKHLVLAAGMLGAGPDLSIPPIPTQFPPTSDPLQQAAQQQILQAEQQAQSQMQSTLSQLASNPNVILQPGDLAAAKAVYDRYGAKGVQSIANIAQAVLTGQPGNFEMMAPLIGAMLTAAAVAPVVGTVVAAGLAILDGIAEALNNALNGQNACTDEKTQWVLPGGACLKNNNGRPTGPTLRDGSPNPEWTTWAQYEAGFKNNGVWVGHPGSYDIDNSFPYYAETIGCEIDRLIASKPGGIRDFFLTFYRAWQHAAEQAINGFKMPDPWTVFAQTVVHWNASHPGPSVTLVPTGFWGQGSCWVFGAPNDPNGNSYIGGLINGVIPNSGVPAVPPYKQNIQINVGGINPWAIALAPGLATTQPSTTSTGTKVAVAGGAAIGASALAIAVASWLTHQTFLTVADKAWDWVKDTVKGKGKSGYRASAIPGARENPLRCPTGSQVVSLLFPAHRYTRASASSWARAHGMKSRTEPVTGNFIHVPQRDPSGFARIRTVNYGRGIKARVGWKRC